MAIEEKKREVVQVILDIGAKTCRRLPSTFLRRSFRSRLAKGIFHALTPQDKLLTYREKELVIQCYSSHWVSYSMGAYEPVTRRVLETLFKPGMVFVDGGANVGLYSLLASKVVGREGIIYAFEPHPAVHAVLQSNLERNHADNVRPQALALGARRGTAVLHHASEPGSHTLLGGSSSREYLVEVLPLDEIVEGQVDLVKLDLEGSESLALQGMKTILSRRRKPVIVMEFSSHWLKMAGVFPTDIITLLESRGYQLKVLDDHRKRGPFELDPREKRALDSLEFDYNLLCLPDEWSFQG